MWKRHDAAGVPLVTIAMPALNEAAHIADAIRSVMPRPGDIACELLVVDGGSTDDTCAIVQTLIAQDPRIRLLHNGQRIQSAGVNLAARMAHPKSIYLVRADCHAAYPQDWVRGLIETIRRRDAVSVVVPLRTIGTHPLQRAIAAAQNSRLGNGGSPHRLGGISGYVAHGHHAAFDRRKFLAVGGYDESFTHNEDAEFDRRLCATGGKIYLAADLAIGYFPRSTFRALARQYFSYGRGCAKTLHKHRALPRLRQAFPPLVLLVCAAAVLFSPVEPRLLAALALYVGACCGFGLLQTIRWREPAFAMSGPVAVVMHLSWGAGFLSRWSDLTSLFASDAAVAGRRSQDFDAAGGAVIALPGLPVAIGDEARSETSRA